MLLWELRDAWGIVIFFLISGGIGVLITNLSISRAEKKKKQTAAAAAEIQEKQKNARRDLFRQARYSPAERQTGRSIPS